MKFLNNRNLLYFKLWILFIQGIFMNTMQERENYLKTLKYGEVKKLATQMRLDSTGGIAAMIPRILQREKENIEKLEQRNENNSNREIGREKHSINLEQQDQSEISQLRQELNRVFKAMDQRMQENEKATMELISHLEDQTPNFRAGKQTVSQVTEKFWPDKRLRNFDLQSEYDHHIKLGRMITQCKLERIEDSSFQETAKEMENIISLRATKLFLADQEGPEFARGLNISEKGTFMEQWEGRIEKLKKTSNKRKAADSYMDNVDLMLPAKKQVPNSKIKCYNCNKVGHKIWQCKEPKKQQENERSQQQKP
jgi:hypothetical protein